MERTNQREAKDVQAGKELMEAVRGSDAETQIEEYLQQYGFIQDKSIDDAEKAEAERHRRYHLCDNIRVFLKRYRAQKEILQMVQEELEARVESETIGRLGDQTEEGRQEGFFRKLSRKLDLLSAYDERAMRARYESRITACRYIEDALVTLERGLRILKAHYPDSYEILQVVYIEGPTQPTIQEAIAKLNLSGSSSYYQKLERAEQRLSGLVLNCTLDQKNFLNILTYLRQQDSDGNFPSFL